MSQPPSHAEVRLRFLLELEDGLRSALSPREVTSLAAAMLGKHLRVDRAGYGHVVDAGQMVSVEQDWSTGDMQSLAGEARILDAFGPAVIAELRAGRTLVVEDCEADARTNAPQYLGTWNSIATRALIVAPILRMGEPSAIVYAHSALPRRWTADEAGTVADTAARTWAAYAQAKAEEGLRASEERLRDITDALPILISYLDQEQRIKFVNKPYEAWFDRPLDQIVGRHLSELMTDAAYQDRLPFIRRALAGEPQRYDVDMARPYGITMTEVTHVPHRAADGSVLGMYTIVQDVTMRKRGELALKQSEARFRQLADLNPAVIWSADDSGKVDYLSNRWPELTGASPQDLTAESLLDYCHPGDLPALMEVWARSLQTGAPICADVRIRRKDGQFVWHSVRGAPVRGAEEEILGWVGALTDIDEAKTRLDERERDRNRLWNLSQELMLVRDRSGIILSVNPSARRLLGWEPEDMLGKSVFEFMHPDDRERTAEYIAQRVAGSEIIEIQNRYRTKDGGYRRFDWRGVIHDGIVHAVGRDITAESNAAEELARTEEALRHAQKMEAVGQLTGGIAHDFNNMLAGIIGSLEAIERRIAKGRLDDTARFMDAALVSAKRAASLTQRLLAFGRRPPLDVKPTDVGALLSSLDDLLRRTLGPSIDLSIRIAPEVFPARADAAQLESAIINLAINARDAMPEGGRLDITLDSETLEHGVGNLPSGSYLALGVADSGMGMPAEILAKAFEPFFTTKPIGQGTGLGLSMIYGFVGQIGGDVSIRSAPGQGTVVTMLLPAALVNEPDQDEPPVSLAAGTAAGKTVLVVEDEPSVRMLIVSLLEDLGYSTLEAGSADAAMVLVQGAKAIDLIVTDVGLPGMNGRQFAEAARQYRPDIPILFLTGYAGQFPAGERALPTGMRIMTKPFSMDELAGAIQTMV